MSHEMEAVLPSTDSRKVVSPYPLSPAIVPAMIGAIAAMLIAIAAGLLAIVLRTGNDLAGSQGLLMICLIAGCVSLLCWFAFTALTALHVACLKSSDVPRPGEA